MSRLLFSIFVSSFLLQLLPAHAANVNNIRLWPAPEKTRVVLELSNAVSYKISQQSAQKKLILDLSSTQLKFNLKQIPENLLQASPIKKIRYGVHADKLRLVFDLRRSLPYQHFVLDPVENKSHRLVIDLQNSKKQPVIKKAMAKQAIKGQSRHIRVVIDAGHGGEDPGAIGPGRIKEKVVVLAIAKALKKRFDQTPGYSASLTRKGDYYVSLRNRTKKAKQPKADLFISIHADAFKNTRARGASVWLLSTHGSRSELGRYLTGKEQIADLIGGVSRASLKNNNGLSRTLTELALNGTRKDSRPIAQAIHKQISKFARMHKKRVEEAGFVVLKTPNIPSVLVETGFISNPGEAEKLRSPSYQRKMAEAIFQGVVGHFRKNPPMVAASSVSSVPLVAVPLKTSYRVEPGDSLSVIARKTGVSVAKLKALNNLRNDTLHVDKQLRLSD